MKVIFEKSVIEMTKKESKEAGRVGTDAFKTFTDLRAAYPGFRIVIRKTKSRDNMKGLTDAYMEKYIKVHNADLLAEFYTLTGRNEQGEKVENCKRVAYGELKKWFLNHFEEIKNFKKRQEEILAGDAA